MLKRLLGGVVAVAIILLAGQLTSGETPLQAQVVSPTPVPLAFPTQAPMMTPLQAGPTDFPTFTPTPERGPYLQLSEGSGEVNIRSDADPEADILGVVQPGDQFEITGTYFLWYQIRYDVERDQRGYVFGQLFDVFGDLAGVPDLTQNTPTPTLDPALFGPTLTYEAIINSPGGEETLAASQQEIVIETGQANGASVGAGSDEDQAALGAPQATARPVLPTFTYPPDVVAQAPSPLPPGSEGPVIQPVERDSVPNDQIAPIVPMAVLLGLGVIAFLLSLLQR